MAHSFKTRTFSAPKTWPYLATGQPLISLAKLADGNTKRTISTEPRRINLHGAANLSKAIVGEVQ